MDDHRIKYTDFNERLSEEDYGRFCELLIQLVRYMEGGMAGMVSLQNTETGETMEVHLSAHDSVLCTMYHLAEIDKTVGTL